MPLPNGVRGPVPLEPAHVEELNRVFSAAFTDRYHRDGMSGVRVPELNPEVWRYAIATAGEGALCWRDRAGLLAAFNLAHRCGSEGWMGPLAVRPDLQGRGLGRTIVTAGVQLLRERGCRTIGLETMPRTVDNIGFYGRLGFRPGHLTVTMVRDVLPGHGGPAELAGAAPDRLGWPEAGRALLEALVPGLDFGAEARETLGAGLGDLTVVRDGERWRGFGLWHQVPLAQGRPVEEIRILKLAAGDLDGFRAVVQGVIGEAARRRIGRVSLRCQTAFREAYGELLGLGFRVHWTDLRMTLADRPERPPARGVVFSNWEL